MKVETTTRILTVDHEALTREDIRNYLENRGFAVTEAENGRSGIDRFEREKPDLVLLDLCMPGMDGANEPSAWQQVNSCIGQCLNAQGRPWLF